MTEIEKLELAKALRDPLKKELLRKIVEAEGDPVPVSKEAAEVTATKLKEFLTSFDTRHSFEKGMLVEWKPGLQNKKKPRYGEPGIVVEVLGVPVLGQTDESGSAYFREPLDLIVGFIEDDGDFVVFHYDQRRFKPYQS
ncbi:MAG: hypothetical protein MUF81_01660 [Verrucomicrobia bacterium]|jgi:hypothetical protein|nr:hypothetical protein [Verrucomicrobiota bacterium]